MLTLQKSLSTTLSKKKKHSISLERCETASESHLLEDFWASLCSLLATKTTECWTRWIRAPIQQSIAFVYQHTQHVTLVSYGYVFHKLIHYISHTCKFLQKFISGFQTLTHKINCNWKIYILKSLSLLLIDITHPSFLPGSCFFDPILTFYFSTERNLHYLK